MLILEADRDLRMILHPLGEENRAVHDIFIGDEFTMKLYLINSAEDPLVPRLFQEEISRHEEKYQYLQARWALLFSDPEEQEKHFGHRCILQQAILREKQRLEWLRQEYEAIQQ